MPPQRWMSFYKKVMTRFANMPGLKSSVSFDVPADQEQSKAKADETRAAPLHFHRAVPSARIVCLSQKARVNPAALPYGLAVRKRVGRRSADLDSIALERLENLAHYELCGVLAWHRQQL